MSCNHERKSYKPMTALQPIWCWECLDCRELGETQVNQPKPRAGNPVSRGEANVLGECPACSSRVGEIHKSWCDGAYQELLEYQEWYRSRVRQG